MVQQIQQFKLYTFSTDEHTAAHGIFTNNKSNFSQLFINSSNVLMMNFSVHQLQQHTIEIFLQNDTIALSINSSKQIMLHRQQNGLSALHDVGQLWCVSLVVFHHGTPHMIMHCHSHYSASAIIFTSESQFSYLFF